MGVPKFFRYISERYPCLSELVKEYKIPEFDNLYLDMNGIIHMCSHPDDNNPHFRITEEKIFQDIFHYIEVLFRMIKPQKLFFMAIDGVAPRAKMNQQRGRRFRVAKDADKMEEDAQKKGEKLPEAARFDSNCITPGTVFMCKLHEQLKYFVVKKISTDPLWHNCKIILSGHETPGEGEHKIMDYIRYMRAQPGYNPNTRHCLYGLDADLIMLGLCTHEPHFSLLREEVKFGKKSTKRQSVPEEITFYLLHLSLMREYLELEFKPLQEKLVGFEYDFEKIIDDWVLMGFLVGNDFIPHLPNLHIANGALPILYKAYMEALPSLNGYINESGTLNLKRFEKFLEKLSFIDKENFEEISEDIAYIEAKTGKKFNIHGDVHLKPETLELWQGEDDVDLVKEPLQPEGNPRNRELESLIKQTEDMCFDSSEDVDPFELFKRDYYRSKLEYVNVTPEVMREQAEGYVRAIQWNLNYYYNGCCSWSWYYPHHYAPYISDIKGFTNLKIEFELGKPFNPFEQLLAVLPSASKNLLPDVYHDLMTSENSPIKQYYPKTFLTDLNGKRQEWEAVVLVPFIDENILLEAMRPCNARLTAEELRRNSHGPMLVYTHTNENLGKYQAPEFFPTIAENHANLLAMSVEDIRVPEEKLVKGAYPGVKLNVYYPGFPTMKHLKYEGKLKAAKIRIFETPSRNENMIVSIIPDKMIKGDSIPVNLLGTNVFVQWPHLVEAKVVAISNNKRKYINIGGVGEYKVEDKSVDLFGQEVYAVNEHYQKRMGIEFGDTKVLVHVKVMTGRKYMFPPNSSRVTLEKIFASEESFFPLQTVVCDISAFDDYKMLYRDVSSVFPPDTICFTLTNPYYGSQGVVLDSEESIKNGRIKISVSVMEEPDFTAVEEQIEIVNNSYKSLHYSANQLGMSNYLFSKLTGSIFLKARNNEGGLKDVNVGLDLKFNKKNCETPGYTRKFGNTWNYSDKAVQLVRDYTDSFPDVVNYISKKPNADRIDVEEIFKDEWEDKLKSLTSYLKNLPTYSMERRTCGSEALELEVVQKIEEIVDTSLSKHAPKKIIMQIRPTFLYKPELQTTGIMPDENMEAQILDRVVNVRIGYSVPFGLKGTIIAIHESPTGNNRETLYDVVFDKPFTDGMALSCSDARGYRLPNTAFINITHGKRKMEEKAGKSADLITQSQAAAERFAFKSPQGPNYVIGQQSAFASFRNSPSKANEQYKVNGGQYSGQPNERSSQSFMPNFGLPKPDANLQQPRPAETDMLKKMLKIGDNNAQIKTPEVKTKPVDKPNPVSFEMFDNVAKARATVKLLTYYQSNRLGCPKYEFGSCGEFYTAQLTLPNGKPVIGDKAHSKDEAAENVAKKVLNIFIYHNQKENAQAAKAFPAPPQNWVQIPQSSHKPEQTQQANKTTFVPLQAMKKQTNKSNHKEEKSKQHSSNQENESVIVANASKTKAESNTTEHRKTDRPRRERKTRIAANFQKK